MTRRSADGGGERRELRSEGSEGTLDLHEARREHLHTRTITCTGHCRSDGMWDIEGQVVDTRTYASVVGEDRRISAGEPVHDLRVKITVDDEYFIRAASAVMQASPYACCVDVTPFYSRLVGLRLVSGFAAAVRERLGGPAGCTHLTELLSPMATTAFQTIVAGRARLVRDEPASPGEHGALLNSCYTLRAGGEVAREVREALAREAQEETVRERTPG